MNKFKWLNLALLISFSLCYLEWGGNQSMMIGQTQYEILSKQEGFWDTLLHPVVLSGLLSQCCLIYAILVPRPLRLVNLIGVVLLSLVVALFLLVGLLSLNVKMILSDIPFAVSAVMFFRHLKHWKTVYPA